MTSGNCAQAGRLGVTSFLLVLIHLRFLFVEAHPAGIDVKRALAQVVDSGVEGRADRVNISGTQKAAVAACFMKVIGRGIGVPLNSCPSGAEKYGLLCYSECQPGYYGIGPTCWQSCPPQHMDSGVFCIDTHRKGCCCTSAGCCGCPQGYTDDGCFCRRSFTKRSYGRGMGSPLTCGPGQEQSGAVCYPRCPKGFIGAGPVCRDTRPAATKFPVKCNDMIWTEKRSTCNKVNANFSIEGRISVACVGAVFAAVTTEVEWAVVPEVCMDDMNDAVEFVKRLSALTAAGPCP